MKLACRPAVAVRGWSYHLLQSDTNWGEHRHAQQSGLVLCLELSQLQQRPALTASVYTLMHLYVPIERALTDVVRTGLDTLDTPPSVSDVHHSVSYALVRSKLH